MFHHFYGKHSWDKSVSCFLSLSPQLLIFIHTDFTDFICKAPVLTIRVISVIRGFLTSSPFLSHRFHRFHRFYLYSPVLTIAPSKLTTSPLPLERGRG